MKLWVIGTKSKSLIHGCIGTHTEFLNQSSKRRPERHTQILYYRSGSSMFSVQTLWQLNALHTRAIKQCSILHTIRESLRSTVLQVFFSDLVKRNILFPALNQRPQLHSFSSSVLSVDILAHALCSFSIYLANRSKAAKSSASSSVAPVLEATTGSRKSAESLSASPAPLSATDTKRFCRPKLSTVTEVAICDASISSTMVGIRSASFA